MIKRRGNVVYIAGIFSRRMSNVEFYWLVGYAEELLSTMLKQPVVIEVQSIESPRELDYKFV